MEKVGVDEGDPLPPLPRVDRFGFLKQDGNSNGFPRSKSAYEYQRLAIVLLI